MDNKDAISETVNPSDKITLSLSAKHYKLKDDWKVNAWEYAMQNNGKLPLEYLEEITLEERLADKEGKTMSYIPVLQ